MGLRSSAAATLLAGALVAGCAGSEQAPNAWTQAVQDRVCTYYNNVFWPDPKDPNGTVYVWKNLLRPVVADCSMTISAGGKASGIVHYDRSPSLNTPTTGAIRTNNLPQSEQQIRDFVAMVNPPTFKWEHVRPFIVPTQNPTVQIIWGQILASASPEGDKSEGDRSLLVPSPKGNTQIALHRSQDVYAKILQTLAKAGVKVTWQDKITTSTEVHWLTDVEYGSLARAEIVPNGNSENAVMEHIARANKWGTKSDAYKTAIEAKRFAKIDLDYKATWVQRVIDVSTAGWIAVWAWALTLLSGLGLWVRRYKKSKS